VYRASFAARSSLVPLRRCRCTPPHGLVKRAFLTMPLHSPEPARRCQACRRDLPRGRAMGGPGFRGPAAGRTRGSRRRPRRRPAVSGAPAVNAREQRRLVPTALGVARPAQPQQRLPDSLSRSAPPVAQDRQRNRRPGRRSAVTGRSARHAPSESDGPGTGPQSNARWSRPRNPCSGGPPGCPRQVQRHPVVHKPGPSSRDRARLS
jgi:hypothetical protein